ncbi:MAG: hypothetical protein ACRC7R_03020 [Sarcina sp.]
MILIVYLFVTNYILQVLVTNEIIEKTIFNCGIITLIAMLVLFGTFKLLDKMCKN